jgi:Protein of unknown function (DUF3035)
MAMRLGWLLTVLSLAACADDGLTRNFGVARDAAPDTVAATQMPLSVPPSLALRPTRPGAPAPHQATPVEQAAGSAGQAALVQAAGPSATADIRQLINENSGMVDPGPEFTDRLLNWTPPPGSTSLSEPAKKGWLRRIF